MTIYSEIIGAGDEIIEWLAPYVPIVFIIVSILSLIIILRKIQKSQMNIDDSVSWFIWVGIFIIAQILILVPTINKWATSIALQFGFNTPLMLLVITVILFMYLKIVSLNLKISKNNENLKKTIQEFAAFKHELDMKEKEKEESPKK